MSQTLTAPILAASPTLAALTRKAGASRAVNLDQASQQWASRPAEERFWDLPSAASHAQSISDRLTLSDSRPEAYDIQARSGRPVLVHKSTDTAAALAPLAFEQLARLTGAPAAYLRQLPAALAADCMRHGWSEYRSDDRLRLQILDRGTDRVSVRAVTSPQHDLTPNAHILRSLSTLTQPGSGWKIPPARAPQGWEGETRVATAADVLTHAGYNGLSPQVGDTLAPSGVYASDRDMFAVLVDDSPSGHMEEDGGLHRFVMVGNSETAKGSLDVTTGWMRGICGNHIIWGARDILNIRAIHKGSSASRAVGRIAWQLERRAWGDDRAETAAAIAAARACQLAETKEDLVSLLFSKKRMISKTNAELAWQVNAELASVDGATGSAWGVSNALTRMSQASPFAADRLELDTAAGRILELARN